MKKNSKPNFSVVSRGEVLSGMRQAKDRTEQKKIFADLCCCSEEDIEEIIKEEEMKSYWSEEQVNTLIRMVEENTPYAVIGARFGKTTNQIATKVYDLRKKGKISSPQIVSGKLAEASITPIDKNTAPGELEYYKERCLVLEAALEHKLRELAYERQSNAELRILARMIGRAVEI